MIAVVDYGVGNLFSLRSSLETIGADVIVTGDAEELRRAEKIILPGVGAFEDAAAKLRQTGLDTVLRDEAYAGKPIMGILYLLTLGGFTIGWALDTLILLFKPNPYYV